MCIRDSPEHGPNGGHLIELGAHEYHAELVMEPETRKISIFLFGHELDEILPIAAEDIVLELEDGEEEIVLTLTPDPLEGETEKASRFSVAGTEVPENLDDIEKLHGHFHVDIAEKEFVGELSHDHGDHDHGDHDHGDHEHEGDDDHEEEDDDHDSKAESE